MTPQERLDILLAATWANTDCNCPWCVPDHPDLEWMSYIPGGDRCRKEQRRAKAENEFRRKLGLPPTDLTPETENRRSL